MFVSDARLVQRVQGGNREAFGLLVERHTSAVYAVALALAGNRADAEDIVQDTFVKAMEAIGTIRDRRTFRAWLTMIARNTARTWLSRKITERAAVAKLTEGYTASASPMVDMERRDFVDWHLAEIGEGHREILLLRYYAGLSDREIGDVLGLTRVAVRKRLQRAREALSLEVVRGLHTPAEQSHLDRFRTRLGAMLALPAVGWRDWVRAALPQWGTALGGATLACGGALVFMAAVGADDGGGFSPPPAVSAPIVLAQAESAEPEADDAPVAEESSVLKIIGSFVKRDVAVNEAKAGRLSGVTVLREDGEPVPGVAIRVERLDWADHETGPVEREEWSATTDGAGLFTLKELPLGRYGIEAHGEGLVGAESASLSQGATSDTITIKMEPALPLGGMVQDENGDALEGAVVYLYTHERLGRGKPLVWDETTAMRRYTDREGRFDFEGVHTGAWTLMAKAEGFAPEVTDTIQAGTTDAVIVMGKGGSVSGEVRHYEGGAPAAGVTLLFRGDVPRFQRSVVTDANGQFLMTGLREGMHHVVLDDPLMITTPDSSIIEIAAEESKSGVVVEIREGGRIRGRVYDTTTKEGIAGVTVEAGANSGAGLERQAESGDDGSFELAGLAATDYMVVPDPPKGYRRPFGSYQRAVRRRSIWTCPSCCGTATWNRRR